MQRGAESARHPRRTTPLRQTTRSPWRNDPHRYRVKWNESIGDDTNNLLYNRNIRLHWDLDDYIDGNVRKAFDWVTYLGSEIAAHGLQKTIDNQERGAFFTDAYDVKHPLVWVSWPRIQKLGISIQHEVIHYEPKSEIIAFVFNTCRGGDNVVIWCWSLPILERVMLHYDPHGTWI